MIRASLLVGLFAVACVDSNQVHCADGRLCAPGNTCDEVDHTCISPEQTAACSGLTDGDACTLATIDGVCKNGACEPFVCGDGLRTGTELCDGSDLGSADCTTAGFYNAAGLACTPFCTYDTTGCTGKCGDGIINGSELCDGTAPAGACTDNGFDAGTLACSASCGASFTGCARFDWDLAAIGVDANATMHGLSPTDLYVVGNAASDGHEIFAHFDGLHWTNTSSSFTGALYAVFEIAPDDAWAVGDSGVFQLAAGQWNLVSGPPPGGYSAVWAAGATSVYVGGANGVEHWDGIQWTSLGSIANVAGLSGTSDSDLWALQSNGTVQHWDGGAWQLQTQSAIVNMIKATGPNEAWAIGISSDFSMIIVEHELGGTWTEYDQPSLGGELTAIAVREPNDVWVAVNDGSVMHFDGTSWVSSLASVTGSPAPFMSLSRFGGELYAVTANGVVGHNAGIVRTESSLGAPGALQQMFSPSPDALFVGTAVGVVVVFSLGAERDDTVDSPKPITALWAASGTDAWAAASDLTLYHYTGTPEVWPAQSYTYGAIHAIWGSSATDVWFFGDQAVHMVDGVFTPDGSIVNLADAVGASADNIWVRESGGLTSTLDHWDGMSWTSYPVPYLVVAMTMTAAGDAYFVSSTAHVVHWDGSAWNDAGTAAISRTPVAISASAPDDIFVASDRELAFFDGAQWSPILVSTPPLDSIRAIAAHRGYVDVMLSGNSPPQPLFRILRTHPWNCRAHETDCSDGVDDDCDGLVDSLDPDCPP